jgi:hypothetical protein
MSPRLDDYLNELRAAPPETNLDGLEADVLRGVAAVREARAAASVFVPVRAAAVMVALGLGLAGGGFAATATAGEAEISAFSVHAHLAPSTLLDGLG